MKRIVCQSPSAAAALAKRIDFACDCDNSISTLIRIYEYELF